MPSAPSVPEGGSSCTEFGAWSECVADAHGIKTQHRTCAHNEAVQEHRICTVEDPQQCGEWSQWSECKNGKQYRGAAGCASVYEVRACSGQSISTVATCVKACAQQQKLSDYRVAYYAGQTSGELFVTCRVCMGFRR